MFVIRARNLHQAMPLAFRVLQEIGERRESRNGAVLVSPEPVCTHYDRPTERVESWSERDSNPFFHFAESLWMLGGRDDIAFLTRFVKRMAQFSDDGETHHGAYGRRWRATPMSTRQPLDQLVLISDALRRNGDDRRQVLQIWDAEMDLGRDGKDVPCNVTATFQMRGDELNLTMFCRSNDVVWGCYGANAVHMSYLLEYVAARVGCSVGWYEQISVNWHGYETTFGPLAERMRPYLLGDVMTICAYQSGYVTPYPLMQSDPDQWDRDLRKLLSAGGRAPVGHFGDPFFNDVALPMLRAHDQFKDGQGEGRFEAALAILRECRATDWRAACESWLSRRWRQFRKEADDGPAA